MTERNEKLQSTKKLIRSILLTGKDGFTKETFLKMYKQFEGSACPYRELGFQSLEHFLKSIPDVVEFRFVNDKELYFGVSDEKTRHISKLVQNQKSQESFRKRNVNPSTKFSARPSEYQRSKMVPREIQSSVDELMRENPTVLFKTFIINYNYVLHITRDGSG